MSLSNGFYRRGTTDQRAKQREKTVAVGKTTVQKNNGITAGPLIPHHLPGGRSRRCSPTRRGARAAATRRQGVP
eukprot:gene19457-biopygen16051